MIAIPGARWALPTRRPSLAALALAVAVCAGLSERAPAFEKPNSPLSTPIAEKLRAGPIKDRREAASQLRDAGRDEQKRALPALIEALLKERDGQVRLAVLESVRALGPDAAPAIPALTQTLRSNYGGQGREELHQDFR